MRRCATARGRASPRASRETRRRCSGYSLDRLIEPRPNLARLLAGSEGTLALFTEIEVELDPLPALRLTAGLSFPTLRAALDANLQIMTTGPSAVELLDLGPLRRAPKLRGYRLIAPLLESDDEAVLLVEYQGSEDEARAGLERLRSVEGGLGAHLVLYFADPRAVAQAWELRRAVLPLLMGAPGRRRPAGFVEDTAVAPEKLGDFLDDFRRLLAGHGVEASFSGHASAGCLHVRPLLDLKTAEGVGELEAIARAVGKLVLEYHGSLSGEHGDGLARSWFNAQLFGPELYAEMVALKELFDPDRLLAPGRVVEGPPPTEHLRLGPSYRARAPWRPRLDHGADGGFDLAVEKCFGAGLCKKLSGVMCPPAAVTRDEALSTRARANLLQALLAGALPVDALTSDDAREILGTCLACKACKNECPAGVDMAALKAEWLAEVRRREGVPLLARGIADFRLLARLAAPVAPLVSALGATGAARAVLARAGVARERPLPAIVRRPLTRRVPGLPDGIAPARRRRASFATSPTAGPPRSCSCADCFVEHQEPEIGEAFVRLLEAAGVPVAAVDAGCCGRTMLSAGLLERARGSARRCAARLAEHARAGRTIAFVEPSCLSMAGRRLGAPAARRRRRRRRRRRGAPGALGDRRPGGRRPPRPSRPAAAPCCTRTATRRRSTAAPRPSVPCAPCPASTSRCSTPAAAACRASSATRRSTTS